MNLKLTILTLFLPLCLSAQVEWLNDNSVKLDSGRSTFYFGHTPTVTGMPTFDNRVIYSMCTQQLDSNSVTETSFFNDSLATGSRTIPANTLQNGDVIRITTRSIFNSVGNPTNTIRIIFGADTIIYSSVTLSAGSTTTYAEINCDMNVCKRSGKYYMHGLGRTILVGGQQRTLATDFTGEGKEIDITVNNEINVTYQWGTANADNWLRTTMGIIQILN